MGDLRVDQAKLLRSFDLMKIPSDYVSYSFLSQLSFSDTILNASADFQFVLDRDRLALLSTRTRQQSPVFVDFSDRAFKRRLAAGLQGQLLGKALGLKTLRAPNVLDATAGLGTDSFLMANAGCLVTAIERSSAIFALLEDGLRRAVQPGVANEASSWVASRIEIRREDFLVADLSDKTYDVVYLDPMFPAFRRKASSRKEMTMLQEIVSEDQCESALLSLALQCAKRRVVVKRNRRSPDLAGAKPTFKLQGSKSRFDVYCC
tara:strand:- start:2726 stop:3511 length:786 start_codon:yes stop_codon:yes gene_type:complete